MATIEAVEQMTDRQKLDTILEAYQAWLTDHSDEADSRVLVTVERVFIAENGGGQVELADMDRPNVRDPDAAFVHSG